MKNLCSLALFLIIATFSLSAASLPFINDDYPKALAKAQHQHLPIFVEVWAPW